MLDYLLIGLNRSWRAMLMLMPGGWRWRGWPLNSRQNGAYIYLYTILTPPPPLQDLYSLSTVGPTHPQARQGKARQGKARGNYISNMLFTNQRAGMVA